MSCDTRIQSRLLKDLKKPCTERGKKFMQNDRLFNRDLNAVRLMTTFLFLTENGKTSLQMSTATNMIWDIRSQKLVGNWNVMNTALTEKQMDQFMEIETSENEIYFHEASRIHLH